MKTFFAQPLITEKSIALTSEGIYQFVVPTWASKRQVADFIAKHFAVTVEDVTTATLRGNKVRFRFRPGVQATYKKASVHLKKGQTISEFAMPVESQSETQPMPAEAEPQAQTKTESKITVRSRSKRAGAKDA